MSDNFEVRQGGSIGIQATLRDANGNPETGYSGSEPLTTTVWPGGNRLISFSPTTTWDVPADATINIQITDAQTTGLDPGRYEGLTRLGTTGSLADVYEFTLDIWTYAGEVAAPPTYTTYNDLLKYGRDWLTNLQEQADEAGFAEQQARARTWLEDILHAHYRVSSMAMVVGGSGLGPRISGLRSQYLTEQLAANHLMVTDKVKEAVANRALAIICKGQVGIGDAAVAYARLARMYNSEAESIVSCLTAEIDTNGDGVGDIAIDCSSTNPMYG